MCIGIVIGGTEIAADIIDKEADLPDGHIPALAVVKGNDQSAFALVRTVIGAGSETCEEDCLKQQSGDMSVQGSHGCTSFSTVSVTTRRARAETGSA